MLVNLNKEEIDRIKSWYEYVDVDTERIDKKHLGELRSKAKPIIDKLSQKPKTMEEQNFVEVMNRKEPRLITYQGGEKGEKTISYTDKEIGIIGEYKPDELIAVVNKTNELFKE